MAYKMEVTLDHDSIKFAAQEYVRREFPDKEIGKITHNGDGTITYNLVEKTATRCARD